MRGRPESSHYGLLRLEILIVTDLESKGPLSLVVRSLDGFSQLIFRVSRSG